MTEWEFRILLFCLLRTAIRKQLKPVDMSFQLAETMPATSILSIRWQRSY